MDPFESMFRWAWQLDFGEQPEQSAQRAGRAAKRVATPAMLECDLSTSHFKMSARKMLQQFQAELIRQAQRNDIDGRAIAGAIAWEYEQNLRGRLSDWLQAPAKSLWISSSSDGLGWGSMHGAEARNLRPKLDDTQLMCARMQAKPALALVAEFMNKAAQTLYDDSGGIWIRDNPVALAGYYQAGMPLVEKTVERQRQRAAGGSASGPVELDMRQIRMAAWVNTNLARFSGYQTSPAPPTSMIAVKVKA